MIGVGRSTFVLITKIERWGGGGDGERERESGSTLLPALSASG